VITPQPSTAPVTLPPTPDAIPTELRVHGVSGTPAEEMLDRAVIGRVAGDHEAGFFRPRPEYGPAATLGPGGARLEAYRWGNLTAGAAARAFWLLLLPFTLANLPIWMLPPLSPAGRRLAHAVCRIFALTVSGTFVLAAIGVFLDLIGWQCAGSTRCTTDQPWLRSIFTGFFEPTGRRLALATVGPIVIVGMLWLLARRTWSRYESYRKPERTPEGDGLATPSFWVGRQQVGRLRSLHTATMFAIIAAVLSYQVLRHDRGTDAYAGVDLGGVDPLAVELAGAVLFLASLGVIGLVVVLLFVPSFVDRTSHSRLANGFSDLLLWISWLLTAGALAYALLPRAPWPTPGPLPMYAETVTYLFAAQAALLAVLALVALLRRRRAKGALFAGFGAPIVASLGLGLGAAFSAAISYRVSDFLDGSAVPSPAQFSSEPLSDRIAPPVSYQWAALGFVFMLVLGGVTVLWVLVATLPALRRGARTHTDSDFPGGRTTDPYRARRIDRTIATAGLTDRLMNVFTVAWFILATAGVAVTVLAVAQIGPVRLIGSVSGSGTAEAISIVTNIGTYLISFSALLLALLGIQTYRNQKVRTTVGIIWDLATFWPRAAHPLAPPCYAERVVPELVHRTTWLATEQGGVILSGHSQGSVLAAATVLQLPASARSRTALLTYGSPLHRLYQRAFPSYFTEQVLQDIAQAVAGPNGQPRWVNLWRRTDPIGGPVGIGDRRLADPTSFGPVPGDHLAPAPGGHSGYQVTPQFGRAVDDLTGLLRH
jgi:hypothetical protein